jgi:ribonuclease HI
LSKAIEELQKRTTAAEVTFLVKVKAHCEEHANEEADIEADKAISGKSVSTRWPDRRNQVICT